MRILAGNTGDMFTDHVAYLGAQDTPFWSVAQSLDGREKPSRLQIVKVPGDHHSSLAPAMRQFLARIKMDASL
jgi:hypothetical protein